jgi:outer membrane protein, heavy metal efflux system
MQYIFVSIFFLFSSLNAYTLEKILELQKEYNKTKSIKASRDAQIAQKSLIDTYDSPRLGAKVAHAKDPIQEGLEYAVGISQNIVTPFGASEKESVVMNLSRGIQQDTKHELHLRELDIASKYYTTCTSKELHRKSNSLFEEQKKRVEELKSVYLLGEISKKKLLFNQLELAKFHKSTNAYKRAYLEEFTLLQRSVGDLVIDDVACSDMVEPKRDFEIKDLSEHGELKRLEYQKNAAKSMYELNASPIQEIGYELLYEHELETDRYSLGITIPLSFVSSKQELLKEYSLKQNTAYAYAKESLRDEIHTTTMKHLDKLEVIYDEYRLLQDEVLPLSKELLELSEYAYKEGEESLMEYLDSSRSYTQNTLEMLEIKKTYYYELFELYKITDMEYGE